MTLKNRIEQLSTSPDKTLALKAVNELRFFLNQGEIRAAHPSETSPTGWIVEEWIKKGILLCFSEGETTEVNFGGAMYFDKSTLPLKKISDENKVRIVPGGTAIRDGVYLGKNVVVMPPSYINIGVYIDDDTLIDSHSLIGTCAQIGKRVHVGAGTQIGGVLEQSSAIPVIIEDDVYVGNNCGICAGTIIGERAVIAPGVNLFSTLEIYDTVNKRTYQKPDNQPLVIPSGAVMVSGMRKLEGEFAKQHQLSVSTPVIVKYRDEKTDVGIVLENLLR
jgi:2,3,4,5-tetrahydropyridine-2-carboxylate N-succinyltransferase